MTQVGRKRRWLEPQDGLKRPGVLIFACALGLALSTAPIFIATYSTFISPLEREFGWSRGALSMLFTIEGVALIVATFFFGPLIQRYGSRRVIIASAILFAASLLGFATTARSYPAFVVWCVLIGATGAGTHVYAYLAILPQWFSQRLGLIFGIVMSGTGLGQLVMPILAQHVTALAGWRAAYAVLAGLVLFVAAPAVMFLVKENPRFSAKERDAGGEAAPGLTQGEALRTPTFWLLWFGFFLVSVVLGGALIHLAPLLIDRGVSPAQAASLVGLSGAAALAFRLLGGYLLDHVGPFVIGTAAFAAAGLGQLCLLPELGTQLAVLAPLLLGLALGVEGDALPYITRQYFGLKAYGLIYNRLFLSIMIGTVVGVSVTGLLFDLTGGYGLGVWVYVGLVVISITFLWLARWTWPHPGRDVPQGKRENAAT